jgi:hypothetical protein
MMRGIPFMLIIIIALAYLAGARWPMLAQKVGLA